MFRTVVLSSLIFSLPLLTTQCQNNGALVIFQKNSNSEIIGKLAVGIANEPHERFQGLRNVPQLSADTGLLFLFEQAQELTFVMGHVLIPLDIIFVDEKGIIINIETAAACQGEDTECGYYRSLKPTYYVVETNAGWSAYHGLKAGDHMIIK